MIARRFYDKGEISLEVACHDIDQWPLPIPGNTLDLPLLGHLMQVYFNILKCKKSFRIQFLALVSIQVQLPSLSTRSVESGCETVSLSLSQVFRISI